LLRLGNDHGVTGFEASGRGGGPLLLARGLGYRRGDDVAFDGVDLAITEGEVVALTGPSGAGKTTLLHVLTGLLVPTVGTVAFDGFPLPDRGRDRDRLRLSRMGFVFQFGELLPELTLSENVELPLRALGAAPADARRRARNLLERLGLGALVDRRLGTVSGGEAQRAAVARAIVHRPQLVVADEPTGSVDPNNSALVLDALRSSADEERAAVLVVTHDPTVAAWADRSLVLARRPTGSTLVQQ
jgi:putative ABC transport system ATP-binding protein